MMVGLPACGKTYWAEQHIEENLRENFVLLGTNQATPERSFRTLRLRSILLQVLDGASHNGHTHALPQVIDQMKIVGLKRQRNYHERWDELITQV